LNRQKYSKGEMLTSEVKKVLIDVVVKLITEHQQRRAKISTEDVRAFMKIRQIKVDVPPNLTENKEQAAPKPEEKKEAEVKN